MKVTHKEEENLIAHYESHPEYYSFASNAHMLSGIFVDLGLNMNKSKHVLDVGCGSGALGGVFSSLGCTYVGVDYSSVRIDIAKSKGYANCDFYLGDVYVFLEKEIEKGNKYDTICIFEVLEHLVEPERVIALCRQLLTDGGSIVASVPHNMPYVAHLQVYIDQQDVQNKLEPNQIIMDGIQKHYFCRWS